MKYNLWKWNIPSPSLINPGSFNMFLQLIMTRSIHTWRDNRNKTRWICLHFFVFLCFPCLIPSGDVAPVVTSCVYWKHFTSFNFFSHLCKRRLQCVRLWNMNYNNAWQYGKSEKINMNVLFLPAADWLFNQSTFCSENSLGFNLVQCGTHNFIYVIWCAILDSVHTVNIWFTLCVLIRSLYFRLFCMLI